MDFIINELAVVSVDFVLLPRWCCPSQSPTDTKGNSNDIKLRHEYYFGIISPAKGGSCSWILKFHSNWARCVSNESRKKKIIPNQRKSPVELFICALCMMCAVFCCDVLRCVAMSSHREIINHLNVFENIYINCCHKMFSNKSSQSFHGIHSTT